MTVNGLDLKKIYYYVICLISFFVMMWGAIDLASSSVGLISLKGLNIGLSAPQGQMESVPSDRGDQMFDAFYQKKMLYDRIWDSLARFIIAGAIFAYGRTRVRKLEGEA